FGWLEGARPLEDSDRISRAKRPAFPSDDRYRALRRFVEGSFQSLVAHFFKLPSRHAHERDPCDHCDADPGSRFLRLVHRQLPDEMLNAAMTSSAARTPWCNASSQRATPLRSVLAKW